MGRPRTKPVKPPEERQTGKEELYAYTITDKMFGELKILNSANAWWLDKAKVHDLINAYKFDAPDEEAIVNAGISLDQLKYFQELHPEFYTIKATCKQYPNLSARQRAVQGVKENYSNAMDYLKRKRRDEFGDKSDMDVNLTKKIISINE